MINTNLSFATLVRATFLKKKQEKVIVKMSTTWLLECMNKKNKEKKLTFGVQE